MFLQNTLVFVVNRMFAANLRLFSENCKKLGENLFGPNIWELGIKVLTLHPNLSANVHLRYQTIRHQRRAWHPYNHIREGLPAALRVVPQP
jgi:hypothetical protein